MVLYHSRLLRLFLIVINVQMRVLVGRKLQDKPKDQSLKSLFINMLDTRLLSRNDESTVWRPGSRCDHD